MNEAVGTRARRSLAVHLPAFRLERCGYGAEDLAALIAEERGATRLVALTPAVRRAGLRRGATAAEARALIPEIALLPAAEADERDDRLALVRVFAALSDRVNFPTDDALVIDITWVARGPDDELAVAQRAVDLASTLGHVARAAVASDPVAARAVAEWLAPDGGVVVVPDGDTARTLAPLPIGAIGAGGGSEGDALMGALLAVGVQTVGQWAALDPAAVAGRYGAKAAALHRIARGLPDPGPGLRPPDPHGERPAVHAAMAGATTTREVGFVLPGLLTELCTLLSARDLAAVRVRVTLQLEGRAESPSAPRSMLVRVGRPTRSVPKLERLIRARLDRVVLDAPIDELGLEVVEAAPDHGWQPGLADRTEAGEPLPDLVARLADLLGDQALFTPVLTSSWRPEAAWRPERFPRPPTIGADPASTAALLADRADRIDPVQILEQREHAWPLPRPTQLLPRPERIEIELAGAAEPARVRLDHGWRRVERVTGPERLCGGWWEASPLDRTYWAIEVDGRGLWAYQDRAGWWLHGWFD